jgi:hypothetical protein
MKWIKASERLPEQTGWYIIREAGSETNYCDNKLFNPALDSKERLIIYKESEWLDESESPSHSPEILVKALEISVGVIRGWHNMSSNLGRLSKEQIDLAWKIYYENAPEMKPIREALTSYREGKGEAQDELWADVNDDANTIDNYDDWLTSVKSKYHIIKKL